MSPQGVWPGRMRIDANIGGGVDGTGGGDLVSLAEQIAAAQAVGFDGAGLSGRPSPTWVGRSAQRVAPTVETRRQDDDGQPDR